MSNLFNFNKTLQMRIKNKEIQKLFIANIANSNFLIMEVCIFISKIIAKNFLNINYKEKD